MTTLANRATPRQARVLRMVEGAVKNALDAHPAYATMSRDRLARSIAKRAAGTLTAGWPGVLALPDKGASEMPAGAIITPPAACGSQVTKAASGAASTAGNRRSPDPLRILQHHLGIMAGAARRAGEDARLAVLADVLRLVAEVKAMEAPCLNP